MPKGTMSRRKKIVLSILAGLLVVVLGVGGYILYLFLNPAKPQITKETGMQCSKVGDCNTQCSKDCPSGLKKLPCMRLCHKRCVKQGCPSAKEPFDKLMACIEGKCLFKCMGGPTPTCIACYEKKCKTLVDTCAAHRCKGQK